MGGDEISVTERKDGATPSLNSRGVNTLTRQTIQKLDSRVHLVLGEGKNFFDEVSVLCEDGPSRAEGNGVAVFG